MQEIDTIDKAIADLLTEDGRMPASEVARRLGDVSERVVRYRMERMLESGVLRVSAVPDPKKIGLPVVADVKVIVEPGKSMEVARKLAQYEWVTYVGCSIGESDVGIQIVARDNEELYKLVADVVGNVEGVVRTTTMIVPVILKDIYKWTIPESVCTEPKEEETPR